MASSSAVADLGKRLLEASRKGNAEEVRQLMATGAPITTDWLGTSPLHLAAQYGHTITAEVLLRAGVSRDGKTKVDKTPLHLAAQHGHLEIANMLLKNGAAVNQVDMLNMTPLHWAVEAHSPEICKLLLSHGATTGTKNKFGKSAMDIIKSKDYNDLIDILLCISYKPEFNNEKQNNNDTQMYIESRKRARTRKFPMTAGSWTGGELQTDESDKPRNKQARMNMQERENATESKMERESVANGNNLSSLVDAAALVRSKAQNSNINNRLPGSISGDSTQRGIPIFTDASVLDTLATLATASTQIITSGNDTTGLPGTKAASYSSSTLAPSYITIPGIQAPVQILHANPNQGGFVNQGPLASALPAGMIQLASPLALNILPGGRLQVGQPVVSGAHLNIPVQMPLQATGVPTGHFFAVSNASNTGINAAALGVVSGGQIVTKQAVGTDTLPSRIGTIMSPVTQGITTGIGPGNLPVNLPIGLLNTMVGGNMPLANIQPLPSNCHTTQSIDTRFIQPKAVPVPVSQISLQPGMAPGQITQAIQYANIAPGIAPIPLFPVAGLGGLQFLPQVIPTQLVNALRGTLPQSPQLSPIHPQFVTPNNAYSIPMSQLNLSSILPTAVSLAQLPLAQQQSLAQQVHASSTQQQMNSLAQHLHIASAQQQLGSLPQPVSVSSTPQPIVTMAQHGLTATQEVALTQPINISPALNQIGTLAQDGLATKQQMVSFARSVHTSPLHQQTGTYVRQAPTTTQSMGLLAQPVHIAPMQPKLDTLTQNALTANQQLMSFPQQVHASPVLSQIAALEKNDVSSGEDFVTTAQLVQTSSVQQHMGHSKQNGLPATEQVAQSVHISLPGLQQINAIDTLAQEEEPSPQLLVNSSAETGLSMSNDGIVNSDGKLIFSEAPCTKEPNSLLEAVADNINGIQGVSPSQMDSEVLAVDNASPSTGSPNDGLDKEVLTPQMPPEERFDNSRIDNSRIEYPGQASSPLPAEDSPGSSAISTNQILPHLQHLIYKQLLLHQPHLAQQPDTVQAVQSNSSHTDDGTNLEQTGQENTMSPEQSRQESPSSNSQEQQQASTDGQPVDLLRFLEQARSEELSRENLKKQLAEAQLETQIYKEELEKAQKELLLKDQDQDELSDPPATDAVDQET